MKAIFIKPWVLSILLIALACQPIFAADYTVQSVGRIQGQEGDWVLFSPAEGWVTQNCSGNGWIALNVSTPGGQAMHANLLLAFSGNYSVMVRINGGCNPGGYYDRTYMIRLVK